MSSASGSGGVNLISSFLTTVKADLDSPVTSNFGSRIFEYRSQAQHIADELDGDVIYFDRIRRVSKEVENLLVSLSRQMSALGSVAKESESNLVSDQIRNWNNNMIHPLDLLMSAPNELRNKGVDKACRDYDTKFVKAEAEAKKHAKSWAVEDDFYGILQTVGSTVTRQIQSGYSRGQFSHGELAEELTNERVAVEYELCKFLLGVGGVEDKKSSQLVRHFLELFRGQQQCCIERLKMTEQFRSDFETLEERMAVRSANSCQQRNALFDLKTRLESDYAGLRPTMNRRGRTESYNRGSRISVADTYGGTSTSSLGLGSFPVADNESSQDPVSGFHNSSESSSLTGFLYKKSNKKLHKQWQKRRCKVQDGCFWLSHSDVRFRLFVFFLIIFEFKNIFESLAPAKLSLLVSDCKPSSEGPRMFDLYCRDRTYHLQAESEAEAKSNREWGEWKKCVLAVRNLPGNHECADCSSTEEVQWLSNTGALVCIACSGAHRELGVHVSRIQSLDLDVISPVEFLLMTSNQILDVRNAYQVRNQRRFQIPLTTGNAVINHIYESDERNCNRWKPRAGCNSTDRQNFIQLKYREKAFVQKIEDADVLLLEAMRELNVEKAYKALLSPNITSVAFEEHGPFLDLIRQNNPLGLPIIQLVVQLGLQWTCEKGLPIPSPELILRNCVQSGNLDALCVLLYNRFGNSKEEAVLLRDLENLALKLGYTEITEVLRIAQSSSRGQLSQITIPWSLVISTSSSGTFLFTSIFARFLESFFPKKFYSLSGSLSQSSSSISPLARPSPEVIVEPLPSQVNVLMRNGTTIAVARDSSSVQKGTHFVSPDANRRSMSPSESHSRFSSGPLYSCSTYPVANPSCSFKGSTFGNSSNNNHFFKTFKSEFVSCFITGCAYNPLNTNSSNSSSSSKSLSKMLGIQEFSPNSANGNISSQPVAHHSETSVTRSLTHVTATPNYYAKVYHFEVPGSLKLSSASGKCNSHEEDLSLASSVPSSPAPSLPTQPKPKMYHRSASEYSQAVTNVGALRELHEQKLSSVALRKNLPTVPDRKLLFALYSSFKCYLGFLKPTTGMSSSFSMASSSVSLDPIPAAETAKKDERHPNASMKERGFEEDGLSGGKTGGRNIPLGDLAFDSEKKNKALTSFDNSRTSFVGPNEKTRLPSANSHVEMAAASDLKKPLHPNSPSSEITPVVPKTSKNTTSAALKLKPPVPTPRRGIGVGEGPQREYIRRCRALYDCVADNPDELSFKQGDVIVISKERIAGENDTWMEGYLASEPQRKGVFPITFWRLNLEGWKKYNEIDVYLLASNTHRVADKM
uniref:Arf-GAP domain-containing protein n=1 Tax=Enterobius vermicularis TaxID=51028 RepID=A0A158QAB9_ENTVE